MFAEDADGVDPVLEEADLVVGPTGKAVPINQAKLHALPRLSVGAVSRSNLNSMPKAPKKPGLVPPFALFSQENRAQILNENKNISFVEIGRKLGEMWRALTESEKDVYRKKSKVQAEQKLKEWQEKIKDYPVEAVNAALQPSAPRRRRTHGYAIFSSEKRKQVPNNVPPSETTKIIAEQWRNAPTEVRQEYEARAAAINETEARKHQNHMLQTQIRQQQLLIHQQQKELLLREHQMQRQQICAQLYPSRKGNLTKLAPGLKITPVTNSSKFSASGVKLPNSITVSKVNSSRGLKLSGPPPLVRGGISPTSSLQQKLAANNLLLQKNLALQRQLQAGLLKSTPNRRSNAFGPTKTVKRGSVCRLCAERAPFSHRLDDKPELVESINFVLNLDVDVEQDKRDFYPDHVCRRCFTIVSTLSQFRQTCNAGQIRLKEMFRNKEKPKTEIVDASQVCIDLDCEVEEEESLAMTEQESPQEEVQNDDDDDIDPLMFLQIGEAQGNFAGHDSDGVEEVGSDFEEAEAETGPEEKKRRLEPLSASEKDDSLENNNSLEGANNVSQS